MIFPLLYVLNYEIYIYNGTVLVIFTKGVSSDNNDIALLTLNFPHLEIRDAMPHAITYQWSHNSTEKSANLASDNHLRG